MPATDQPWGDCSTLRNSIPYSYGPTLQEQYRRGEPRTIQNVVRVRYDVKDAFLRDILPDVSEVEQTSGQQINLGPAGTTDLTFRRNKLVRKIPERHPRHQNMWATDAVVLRGEGAHRVDAASNPNLLTFSEYNHAAEQWEPGFAYIAVTWSDLPFVVHTAFKTVDGRTMPDEDASDADANGPNSTELQRWCKVTSVPKGQNLTIRTRLFYFVNDDGTPARKNDNNPNSPLLAVPEANQAFHVPSEQFTVTVFMVPRVPLALQYLRNHVNATRNLVMPREVFPAQLPPEVGTLLFLGHGLSDPYFTITGRKVYDLTIGLLWRPGGGPTVFRGHNATWCAFKRKWLRVVAPRLGANGLSIASPSPLPKSGSFVTGDSDMVVPDNAVTGEQHNVHPFAAEFENLFRFEGAPTGGDVRLYMPIAYPSGIPDPDIYFD